MSVLVSDRKESKFEAITFSIELHDMLLDFMQRNFGVKDLEHFVRVRYAYGDDETEDFAKYRYLMTNFKNRIDLLASQLTNNVRAANSTYPTSMPEYEQRRSYQNSAIVNCEQIIKELQRIVAKIRSIRFQSVITTAQEPCSLMIRKRLRLFPAISRRA